MEWGAAPRRGLHKKSASDTFACEALGLPEHLHILRLRAGRPVAAERAEPSSAGAASALAPSPNLEDRGDLHQFLGPESLGLDVNVGGVALPT